MSFTPASIRGSGPGAASEIDYRLARESVVREFHKGRLSKLDVCDAHPELLRAARNVAEPTGRPCPICETAEVVLVSYAFGARLPAGGRCVTSKRELDRLRRQVGDLACYVVEVCPECSWNHLARSFTVSRPARR